jgi:mono/diheme cytochrome c family protein
LKAPKGYPDFDDFPGKLSRKNPWELVHKIRFGQPGTKMPRASTLGHAEIRALGAYIQTLGR